MGVSDSESDISGRSGGEPVGGFGVGQEQRLRLVGGALLDDVDAARVRAEPRGGAGYRGGPLPCVGTDPREDHGGELLAGGGVKPPPEARPL